MASNRRRALRDLYGQVPTIACTGLCADSCGPIDMSTTERSTLRRRGIEITPKERAVEQLVTTGDFTCDALHNGRCSVYEDRPMICRLWGVTETLRCPHGCEAEGVLTDRDGFGLIAESLRIGGAEQELPPTEHILRRYDEHRELVSGMMSRPTAHGSRGLI